MVAGDLLLFVDNLTSGLVSLVWSVVLLGVGAFTVFRSTQNPKITDLRLTGGAMLLWVVTDIVGWGLSFVTGFFDGILANIGLYMSTSAISEDVGSMVGAIIVGMGGVGLVQTLLALAGGPPIATVQPKAAAPAIKSGPPIGVPGGPPGAPGPPS